MQRNRTGTERPIHPEALKNAGPITKAAARGYHIEFAHTTVVGQPMTLIGIRDKSLSDDHPLDRFLAAGQLTTTQAIKAVIILKENERAEAANNN